MSKLTKTEAETAVVKDLQTKDSLTESDIKAIEDKLLAKFNSQFADFAKRVIESPPTSATSVKNIQNELSKMYTFTDNIARTMKSLNELKLD